MSNERLNEIKKVFKDLGLKTERDRIFFKQSFKEEEKINRYEYISSDNSLGYQSGDQND